MGLMRHLRLREAAVTLSAVAAEVKPGTRFSRQRRDKVTELATVIDVRDDLFGIPHVRFTLAFEQPSKGRGEESTRVLALQSFLDTYRI